GLAQGRAPRLAEDSVGGTYYLSDASGRRVAVFKPADEEAYGPNNPHQYCGSSGSGGGSGNCGGSGGCGGALRECAAFLLDDGFAGVPPTAMVIADHAACHHGGGAGGGGGDRHGGKVGSLQVFVPNECTAEDLGPSLFPTEDVHRIAILDVRLCNMDRHVGNILVQRPPRASPRTSGSYGRAWRRRHARPPPPLRLVPIDHGLCLPHVLRLSDAEFAWRNWPAAREPLSDACRRYVNSLDADADIARLRARLGDCLAGCLLSLRVGTALLKRGVAAGLTLCDIGTAMTREHPDSPCLLEEAVAAA
ncbi:unnamed protein product, partial [Phaeothamnion confervicola]